MSEADPRHEIGAEAPGEALAQRLGALGAPAAAPPAPAAVIGVVRMRRRVRRAAWTAAVAGVLAIAVAPVVLFRSAAPAGAGAVVDEAPRWAHLTGADMPSAARLRHIWLQTGDLPASPPTDLKPAATPLRPLDALDTLGLDRLG